MKHLLICREYPPAAYPVGGIGTYAGNIARLLAAAGETVHVIAQRWAGASSPREESADGRLIIHRIYMEPGWGRSSDREWRELFASDFPPQAFAWRAALLAERLIEEEGIDLVEGQDWEAPLYFLQRRRAEGQGPKRQPPCLLHLHSPTEMIVAANGWDPSRPDRAIAASLEDHSIRAADGWISPSRFLARAVAIRYAVPEPAIEVIPYPLSPMSQRTRSTELWGTGPIVYVGRMERRKGVLDWVEAAVSVARRHPTARFELVGPDSALSGGSTMRQAAQRLVPTDLGDRFTFHPEMSPTQVGALLTRARIGVVPSRWDNFPNTCIEAMQSGLPVLTTRQGGMAEVVVDDETGWLAETAEPVDLASTLERALACTPERLATMGATASDSIRRSCDPDRIVAAHLAFRRALVEKGSAMPTGSMPPRRTTRAGAGFVPSHHGSGPRAVLSLPVGQQLGLVNHAVRGRRQQPVNKNDPVSKPTAMDLGPGVDGLVSVVMPFLNVERFLPEAIDSVLAQTYTNWELLLVDDGSDPPSTEIAKRYEKEHPGKIRYLEHEGHANRGEGTTRNLGIRQSRGQFVGFLDADDVWLPPKLERQVAIMNRHPKLGMVYGSNKIWYSWTGEPGDDIRDHVRPTRVPLDTVIAPPRLLIPLLREDEHAIPSDMLFRREAIDRSGGHVEGIPPGGVYEDTRLLAKLYLTESVYKASETWLWYRIRPDSVLGQSIRTGRNLRSRLNFLLWFTDYVRQRDVVDLEFLKVLKETVRLSQRIVAEWPWSIFVAKGNRAKLAVSRQKTRVSIDEVAEGENWDIHLNIRQPAVEAGQPYRVRFMAKADRPRKAYVGVARADAPWDGLGWYQEIDLTNKWRWVAAEFVATGDTDAARVHFNVGLEAISVDLKDVSLSRLDQVTSDTGSDSTGVNALNGKHHLGSWSLNVTEGNEAKLGVRSRQRVARVDIAKTTSDVGYDVQLNLQQDGIRVGRRYRIQFEARADRPRTAFVGVARFGPPWDGLGWYQSVDLTSRWKHVDREFVALDDADIARVHFDLGVEAIPVEVRAVTLTEADPAPDSESHLELGH